MTELACPDIGANTKLEMAATGDDGFGGAFHGPRLRALQRAHDHQLA
jgi:hypothetical protein